MKKYTAKNKKKQWFEKFSESLVSEKTFLRIQKCGGFLMFLTDICLKNMKLHSGDFCKNRFCPMCSWRLARKDGLKITVLMEYIRQEFKKDFIFLTLTTPNVTGDNLEAEIKKYNKSFKKFMERKEIEIISKGYIRKLEVTYDKEEFITKELYDKKKNYYVSKNLKIGNLNPTFNTYHPHFHVVIAVNKSYFTDKDYYINQKKWLRLWQEVTGDSSISQVNIKKTTNGDLKEVYEIAKYSAKDSDYLVSESVFKTFYNALKRKQFIVYGGLFAEALKHFKEHKLDKYKQKDFINYFYIIVYKWQLEDYQEYIKRELTKEEKQKFNAGFIDDTEVEIDNLDNV